MKHSILFSFVLSFLFIQYTTAQITEAEVIYEDKTNIHRTLPEEMQQWKDRIPEFRTVKKVLLVNENETLYKKYVSDKPEEEVLDAEKERSRRWRGRMNRDENQMYSNVEEKLIIEEREFFGKKFLIEGAEEPLAWKISGEQKQVGSYLCMKATFQDTTQSIVAWFTPMIPVASGPDKYNQLPGLILHMDFNNGERTITATEVNPKEIDDTLVVKPEKGDKITREEFDQMVEEKTAEMKEMYGSSRGRRFIRRN